MCVRTHDLSIRRRERCALRDTHAENMLRFDALLWQADYFEVTLDRPRGGANFGNDYDGTPLSAVTCRVSINSDDDMTKQVDIVHKLMPPVYCNDRDFRTPDLLIHDCGGGGGGVRSADA